MYPQITQAADARPLIVPCCRHVANAASTSLFLTSYVPNDNVLRFCLLRQHKA